MLIGLASGQTGTPAAVVSASFFKALWGFLSWIGPLVCVLMAIASALVRATSPRDFRRSEKVSPALFDGSDLSQQRDQEDSWQQVDASTWNLPLLKALEWKRLEQLGAAYFRALKFRVEEGTHGPDGGVDLRLYAGDATTPGVLVQCKAWSTWKVGVKEIRELFGVMASEGVNEGIFVTTSFFSQDALEFAAGKNIHLVDGNDLLQKLLDLPPEDQRQIIKVITAGDFTTPTCPSCGTKMVKRAAQATGDSFWGCPQFPRCRSTIKMRQDQQGANS
jgi:restriction system protein